MNNEENMKQKEHKMLMETHQARIDKDDVKNKKRGSMTSNNRNNGKMKEVFQIEQDKMER